MEGDPLHFEDSNFRIEPSSGTVWPGSTLDVKIYFQPQKATEIAATAYCEIDGRESRLPLHFNVSPYTYYGKLAGI
jgi:hydrocephalus-inducing protein